MRVAFLSFHFFEYSVKWVNGLAAYADVLLILPEDAASFRAQIDERVRVTLLPTARMRHVVRNLGNMRRIWRVLRDFAPDVLHVQQGFIWFNLLLPLFRRYPLVITVHDPLPHKGDREQKTPHWIFAMGFQAAQQLVVHGETLKTVVVNDLHIPAERVQVIPHVELGDSSVEMRDPVGPHVLFFGRIWEYKGLDYLIRAEPLIAAEVPQMKIIIAGRGEDFSPYEALMVDKSRYIVRNEFIPDDDIASLFLDSAVVVLPYVEATQSGVVPYAYTYARPVVATRVGALPDAVQDEVTGLLVPPRDVKALADAIICLLKNPVRAAEMGRAGQNKLKREASSDVIAHRSLEVYQQAIKASGKS